MNRTLIASTAALVSSLAVACTHDNPPPKTADGAVTVTQASSPRNGKSDQTVNVSQDIRAQCGIDDSDRAPKFDFDSTQLAGNDRDVLQKVAVCFTTGPLKGRALRLIGRADPRGEAEYNMNLGESRATSVRKYLASLGVAAGRMSETSRGAIDATGHDEETWRKDRRVDVDLDK
jgi:peptidoglycan-associated lipoprotein